MNILNRKDLSLVLLFLAVAISYISWDTRASTPVDLEFRVMNVTYPEHYLEIAKKPPRKTDYANVTIEYMIINNGESEVTLNDIKITSYFGGFQLGNSTPDDSIKIRPEESYNDSIRVEEDWSSILTIEMGMDFYYGLETRVGGFFSKEDLLIFSQIYIEEQTYPVLVDTDVEFLDKLSDRIYNTGMAPDNIPPIDDPHFIPVNMTDFMKGNEIVYILESTVPRIYPRKIMLWHEIVNDEVNDENVSITYCPLTESAIGYKVNFRGNTTTFGTSGRLLNSNLVLYDRETNSLWPQILGKSVEGKWKGVELDWIPMVRTTWRKAKTVYPDALVLSLDTGFYRNYNDDPYREYVAREKIMFPVMHRDDRLDPHTIVIGVKNNNETAAFRKDNVRERGSISFVLGGESVVAVYDESLDTIRVSSVDSRTIESIEIYWFSWYAYYPETHLIIQ